MMFKWLQMGVEEANLCGSSSESTMFRPSPNRIMRTTQSGISTGTKSDWLDASSWGLPQLKRLPSVEQCGQIGARRAVQEKGRAVECFVARCTHVGMQLDGQG
jgi:hypothetical protein